MEVSPAVEVRFETQIERSRNLITWFAQRSSSEVCDSVDDLVSRFYQLYLVLDEQRHDSHCINLSTFSLSLASSLADYSRVAHCLYPPYSSLRIPSAVYLLLRVGGNLRISYRTVSYVRPLKSAQTFRLCAFSHIPGAQNTNIYYQIPKTVQNNMANRWYSTPNDLRCVVVALA